VGRNGTYAPQSRISTRIKQTNKPGRCSLKAGSAGEGVGKKMGCGKNVKLLRGFFEVFTSRSILGEAAETLKNGRDIHIHWSGRRKSGQFSGERFRNCVKTTKGKGKDLNAWYSKNVRDA